jgi:hypothetical protein
MKAKSPAGSASSSGGGTSSGSRKPDSKAMGAAVGSASASPALAMEETPMPALALGAEQQNEQLIERPVEAPGDAPSLTTDANDSEIERIKSALEARRKMFLVTALDGSRSAAIDGNEFYIEFAPEARHLRDTLAKSDNVKILREICQEITGKDLGVRIMIKDQTATADDASLSREDEERLEQQRLREDAEKHPVVQQMLRTFRGEIVDVRRVDKPQN